MDDVLRPRQIDLLLSAKSNHLMSDEVLNVVNGVKLYRGPLGMTFFGTPDTVCNMEHIKSYPTRATPVFSSVKRATVIRSLTDREIGNILYDCFRNKCLDISSWHRLVCLQGHQMHFPLHLHLTVTGGFPSVPICQSSLPTEYVGDVESVSSQCCGISQIE